MTAQHDSTSPVATNRDRVLIFDTTLRDGEQCPGATMSFEDKLEVAMLLDGMGVDIIEAGFPYASQGDFEAVSEIARRMKNATVAGLSRASLPDIDRCAEAVKHALKPRIHTFIATSPIHMKRKLQMEPEQVLELIVKSVSRAKNHVDDVEWSCEDGTRSDIDFLCRCVEAAIKAGATTINMPDTVGYTTPDEYETMFRTVRERVPNADKAIFSTHCHNDLGLAVANTIAGLARRGAADRMHHQRHRRARGKCGAGGGRDGDLRTRADILPFYTNNIEDADAQCAPRRLVSAVTSFPVQYNKAIVGRNAFAHESGIHQDGMLKDETTYEIMRPESVGVAKTSLVMGKHSGRAAFREKLRELGYELGDNALNDAFKRFKDLADRKRTVYDEDIAALVDDEILAAHDRYKVASLTVIAGTNGPQSAAMAMDIDGERHTLQATGNGPVDAIFNAVRGLVPHEAKLELYQVHAVTEGTDAQAEVSVRLSEAGRVVTGRAADPDTLVASARAYVAALNKIAARSSARAQTAAE